MILLQIETAAKHLENAASVSPLHGVLVFIILALIAVITVVYNKNQRLHDERRISEKETLKVITEMNTLVERVIDIQGSGANAINKDLEELQRDIKNLEKVILKMEAKF